MQTVLITGSEGFVGQHLINTLKDDYSIIGLNRSNPLTSTQNVQYIEGDILNADKMLEILNQYSPNVIIHLAGIAKTWDNNPQEVFNINLFGTLNILEAVMEQKKASGYNPKILCVSSAESYGKTTNPQSIRENDLVNPINTYGVSKLAADRLSYQYAQTDHLKIVILRPFPHIGPGQQKGFFVPDMASQLTEIEKDPAKKELLVGNLEAIRDYLDVRDVVRAYKLVIEKDFEPGEVFNICSGEGIKIEDILHQLIQLTKTEVQIKKDESRVRSVDLPVFVGNNQKITSFINWTPQIPLDQTLQDVMEYWRNK